MENCACEPLGDQFRTEGFVRSLSCSVLVSPISPTRTDLTGEESCKSTSLVSVSTLYWSRELTTFSQCFSWALKTVYIYKCIQINSLPFTAWFLLTLDLVQTVRFLYSFSFHLHSLSFSPSFKFCLPHAFIGVVFLFFSFFFSFPFFFFTSLLFNSLLLFSSFHFSCTFLFACLHFAFFLFSFPSSILFSS